MPRNYSGYLNLLTLLLAGLEDEALRMDMLYHFSLSLQ